MARRTRSPRCMNMITAELAVAEHRHTAVVTCCMWLLTCHLRELRGHRTPHWDDQCSFVQTALQRELDKSGLKPRRSRWRQPLAGFVRTSWLSTDSACCDMTRMVPLETSWLNETNSRQLLRWVVLSNVYRVLYKSCIALVVLDKLPGQSQ